MESKAAHWDAIFANTAFNELGWYEQNSNLSLQFLNQIKDWQTATIFVSGAGTTNLIEELLTKNTNLVVNDISAEADFQLLNHLETDFINPKGDYRPYIYGFFKRIS